MKKKTTQNARKKASRKNPARTVKSEEAASDSAEELQERLTESVRLLSATNRQLKRKIFDLYTVFEISRNFSAVLDYQSLLDSFIFTCLGQVGALKGTIFLKKSVQTDRFYPAKSKGSGTLPGPGQYFEADAELARYLTRLNRPAKTEDLMGDVSTDAEKSILMDFESGIIVPLIYQTRLSGIFAMAEKVFDREFSEDDIEFLSILGNQIAVAIENARLYESEKMATQQLRAAQQQLLHSEKLAALGELSAKIAHEVNNPLGIIKNYIVLLKRSLEESDPSEEYVEIVGEEIDRIAQIVKQLLEFHRPQVVEKKPVKIAEVVGDVLVLMERQLVSCGIQVSRNFPPEDFRVHASPENLKQVFLNLLVNARDAMTKGGELTISILRKQDTVCLRFLDTGPGIPAELIPRIFEPLFTTKEPGEGTGLGLSVCYGIIKNHGGSITFKNLETGGCFEVRLPLIVEKEVHDTAG